MDEGDKYDAKIMEELAKMDSDPKCDVCHRPVKRALHQGFFVSGHLTCVERKEKQLERQAAKRDAEAGKK